MMGLDAEEVEELRIAAAPGISLCGHVSYPCTCRAVDDRLSARGLIYFTKADDGARLVWATSRGLLALRCHEAAQAASR